MSAKEAPAIFTLTDGKGNYKLEIPNEVKALVFSYSGMADKIAKIGELKSINVKLITLRHKRFRLLHKVFLQLILLQEYSLRNYLFPEFTLSK